MYTAKAERKERTIRRNELEICRFHVSAQAGPAGGIPCQNMQRSLRQFCSPESVCPGAGAGRARPGSPCLSLFAGACGPAAHGGATAVPSVRRRLRLLSYITMKVWRTFPKRRLLSASFPSASCFPSAGARSRLEERLRCAAWRLYLLVYAFHYTPQTVQTLGTTCACATAQYKPQAARCEARNKQG